MRIKEDKSLQKYHKAYQMSKVSKCVGFCGSVTFFLICFFQQILLFLNRSRIMESLHKWSKEFKCDTLYCCYLHRLVEIGPIFFFFLLKLFLTLMIYLFFLDDLRTMGFLMGNAGSLFEHRFFLTNFISSLFFSLFR
ncbi:hypothetical protein C1646_346043 [Rhizophagus diaphanus]|nr:hypothetical protein C1646_346043 [Rhizophagus diaphanus] [Rhizophagus sp. MUCL 43196]